MKQQEVLLKKTGETLLLLRFSITGDLRHTLDQLMGHVEIGLRHIDEDVAKERIEHPELTDEQITSIVRPLIDSWAAAYLRGCQEVVDRFKASSVYVSGQPTLASMKKAEKEARQDARRQARWAREREAQEREEREEREAQLKKKKRLK